MRRLLLLVTATSLGVIQLRAQGQPDLRFPSGEDDFGTFSPTSLPQGGVLHVTFRPVHNTGTAASAAFRVGIYLSSDDEIIEVSDQLVQGIGMDGLAVNSWNGGWQGTVTIPEVVQPGQYRVGFIIDYEDQVTETNEANNTGLALPRWLTIIAGGELAIAPLLIAKIVVGSSDQPAIQAGSTRISLAPGGTFFIRETRVHNQGGGTTTPFDVGYYVSSDPEITPDDNLVGEVRVGSIQPYDVFVIGPNALNRPTQLKLPSQVGPGDYFFGAFADTKNEVAELSGLREANNGSATIPMRLLDVASDDVPVWQVRLRLKTGTKSLDATNDGIFVGLTKHENFLQDRFQGQDLNLAGTWLDYTINDFEPGEEHNYTLRSRKIQRLGDINRIWLGKKGSDHWCVAHLQLEINGAEMFSKNFSTTADNCHRLTSSQRELLIGYTELRSSPTWQPYNTTALSSRSSILREEIEGFVQTQLGHKMFGTTMGWAKVNGVRIQVTRRSSTSITLQVGVKKSMEGADPEALVGFDVLFTSLCAGSTSLVTANIIDFRVGASPAATAALFASPLNTMAHDVARELDAALKRAVALRSLPNGQRPAISVTSNADLTFGTLVACGS